MYKLYLVQFELGELPFPSYKAKYVKNVQN